MEDIRRELKEIDNSIWHAKIYQEFDAIDTLQLLPIGKYFSSELMNLKRVDSNEILLMEEDDDSNEEDDDDDDDDGILESEQMTINDLNVDEIISDGKEVPVLDRDGNVIPILKGTITSNHSKYLNSLNSSNWKEQDHYRVLGLDQLRFRATNQQIRKAYQVLVLQCHPDKLAKKKIFFSVSEHDRDVFVCIFKAFEILGNEKKKLSFDSVDPTFDDYTPPINISNKKNFFETFGSCFERNSRWSLIQPVPILGDINTLIQEVENFYDFWFSFQSWREFSYRDKEDKDTASDREERRWLDKQNKAERQKLKKSEMERLKGFVENAYECDPRITLHKEMKKKKKEDEKKMRREQIAKKNEEERLKREQIENAKREEERLKLEEQNRINRLEKEKRDEEKRKLKEIKKILREIIQDCKNINLSASQWNVFYRGFNDLSERLQLHELEILREEINSKDSNKIYEIINLQVKMMQTKDQNELKEKVKSLTIDNQTKQKNIDAPYNWNEEETSLLVHAIQLIPGGTRDRWNEIRKFMEEHSKGKIIISANQIIKRAKELKAMPIEERRRINENAVKKVAQLSETRTAAHGRTIAEEENRMVTPQEIAAEVVWTTDEQKVFQQALRTYPTTTPERWEKIAAELPNKSKQQCLLRFKHIAEMLASRKRVLNKK
ncbi:hypothetical protein SNEBB_004250 [Seison nebaliae]|nr:hypothetical protein SNEBB_004250 [Seison nebaliae]